MAENEELPAGSEYINGVLHGWTGRDCPRCGGTGEDFSDANAPYTTCRKCGGTGEEWGKLVALDEVDHG